MGRKVNTSRKKYTYTHPKSEEEIIILDISGAIARSIERGELLRSQENQDGKITAVVVELEASATTEDIVDAAIRTAIANIILILLEDPTVEVEPQEENLETNSSDTDDDDDGVWVDLQTFLVLLDPPMPGACYD